MIGPTDPVEELICGAMRDGADGAPSAASLLTDVHRRSRKIKRRRTATVTAVAGVTLVAGLAVPLAIHQSSANVAPAAGPSSPVAVPTTPSVMATGSGSAGASAAGGSAAPGASGSAGAASGGTGGSQAVRLVSGYTPPTCPLTLPAASGYRDPVVSVAKGAMVAFFETTDPQRYSDITVTISSGRPTFDKPTAAMTETARTVRGHAATLRTVAVSPAAELALYWQEKADQWVTLRTDDTFTPDAVVAKAERLTSAALAVRMPFTLDLAPSGATLVTASASAVGLRVADLGEIVVALGRSRSLAGTPVQVGGRAGALSRTATAATLLVDYADRGGTLTVQVPAGYSIGDDDLVRFAAGVHPTSVAEVAS